MKCEDNFVIKQSKNEKRVEENRLKKEVGEDNNGIFYVCFPFMSYILFTCTEITQRRLHCKACWLNCLYSHYDNFAQMITSLVI